MRQIVGWVLGVLLCFVLLVVTPILITSVSDELAARRQIDNEITMFIDSVRDCGYVTDEMLDDFYLGVNSYGITMDVKIMKYSKVVNPDPVKGAGHTYTSYVASEDYKTFQQGDLIKVKGTPVGRSSGNKILASFLRFSLSNYEPTYVGRIR